MLTQFLNGKTMAVGQRAESKDEAIRLAGELLVRQGLVEEHYIDEMIAALDQL